MVVIRLARHGAKHNPFYHVTVADKRARRDGSFIERIGYYNPVSRGQAKRLQIDFDRLAYWQGVGAQTTDRVRQLIKEAKRDAANEPIVDENAESNLTSEGEAEAVAEAVPEEQATSAESEVAPESTETAQAESETEATSENEVATESTEDK